MLKYFCSTKVAAHFRLFSRAYFVSGVVIQRSCKTLALLHSEDIKLGFLQLFGLAGAVVVIAPRAAPSPVRLRIRMRELGGFLSRYNDSSTINIYNLNSGTFRAGINVPWFLISNYILFISFHKTTTLVAVLGSEWRTWPVQQEWKWKRANKTEI